MHWDTGQLFEILATGDGYFMYKVLQAISMLWSAGVFNGLGAVGLLIGLLAMGAQTVSSGGQRMDLGSLFTGFLLWGILFAGGASVQVTEVGYTRPGSGGQASYVVDDVPFGLAVGGWLISNIGKKLTETIEQSFGLIDEGNSVLKTGPGRSLDWLASVRLAGNINVGSNDNKFAVMRANLVNYMRVCTSQAITRDKSRAPAIPYESSIFDFTKGIGFQSSLVSVEWYEYSGAGSAPTVSEKTCTDATNGLQAYFVAGESAIQDFSTLVARPRGFGGSMSSDEQLRNAAQAVNFSMDEMQKYMLGTAVAQLWDESIEGSSLMTPEQVTSRIMISQAVQQRATQYAAEESMFKRSMFPLMSFLECLLYIAAPFVALALGLGRAGIGIAMKYAMTSLWVVLWMPTMAVVNFFQITSFERTMETFKMAMGTEGGVPYQVGSIAASMHIQEQVLEWISVGSMLSASVPMIALVLLTGSAFSMTSLASAFKGGDFVNEKMMSPDVADSQAALGRGAWMKHDMAGGMSMNGAAQPTLTFSRQLGVGESSSLTEARQNMAQWTHGQGKQVSSQLAMQALSGVRGSQSWSERADLAASNAYDAVKSSGVDLSNVSMAGFKSVMAFSMNMGAQGSLDLGALSGLKGFLAQGAAKAGEAAKAAGGSYDDGVNKFLSEKAGAVGAKVSAGMKQEDMIGAIADQTSRLASSIAAKTSESESVRASVTGSNVASAEEYASIQGSSIQSVTNSDDLRKVGQAAESINSAYAKTASYNSVVGSGISMQGGQLVNAVAQADVGAGKTPNYAATAERLTGLALGNGVSIETLEQATQANMSWAGTRDQARIAAVLGALNGSAPGSTTNDKLGTAGQREALGKELTRAGVMGGGSGSPEGAALNSNPSSNQGVAPNASAAGQDAVNSVEGGGVGVGNPAAVESGVKSGVASLNTPGGRQAALGRVGGTGIPVGRAMAGGARGASINGGGGAVNEGAADAAGAGVLAEGHAQEKNLYGQGQASMAPTQAAHLDKNWANSSAPLGRAGGSPAALIGSYHGYPMDEVIGGKFGTNIDNPYLSQHAANVAAGQFSGGTPLNSDAALVIGAVMALGSNGGPMSTSQGAQVKAAMSRLSPQQMDSVYRVINSIEADNGKSDPGELPASAVSVLSAGPLEHGGSVPTDVQKSQGAPMPSQTYTATPPGHTNTWEHVNFRAEGGKSPYERARAQHDQGVESGLPVQGEGGMPVGPWQQSYEDARKPMN